MSVELKNTYVIRTDDNDFRKELDKFLASHCEKKGKNAAVFDMTEKGADKDMLLLRIDMALDSGDEEVFGLLTGELKGLGGSE